MKKYLLKAVMGLLVLSSSSAFSWVISTDATVSEVIQWNDNQEVYFKLSTGTVCYMPANEDKFYSLLLSLWATGKSATFHCWVDTKTTQGMAGHRVHRIIAKS